MQLPVADLSTIVEVLAVGDNPHFVVFQYRHFVRFATIAYASHVPDVTSVLDVGASTPLS